jgi:hypothetical protein
MTNLGLFERREKRRGLDRLFRRPTQFVTKFRRLNQQQAPQHQQQHQHQSGVIQKNPMAMGGSFSSPSFSGENDTTMMTSSMNYNSSNSSSKNYTTTFRKLQLNASTTATVKQAVLEHLGSTSSKTSKVIDLAVALGQRDDCKSSYAIELTTTTAREHHQPPAPSGSSSSVAHVGGVVMKDVWTVFQRSITPDAWSWAKHDRTSMRRRYEWVGAFEELEKRPSSRTTVVSCWDEAVTALGEILIFTDAAPSPSSNDDDDDRRVIQGDDAVDPRSCEAPSTDSIHDRHSKKLDAAMSLIGNDNYDAMSGANMKWRQIAAVSVPQKLCSGGDASSKEDADADQDLADLIHEVTIHKADQYFNARIQTAEELDKALRQKNDATILLEERMKAAQAKKRAASLMRPLSDDERDIVHQVVFGYGNGNDIVAQYGSDSVLRSSIQTLQPGTWLNDEIIHYFYQMLANRDEELCEKDPSRQRSHFFKSFFITKLLNEGNANPAIDGTYEYRNVKRWSKNVPGKDIFGLDKIVFPINMGGMHWICGTIFMKDKKIEIFDSMGSGGQRYLQALFQYVQDEHQDKKKCPLPDVDMWMLVPTRGDTPRQRNGKRFPFFH